MTQLKQALALCALAAAATAQAADWSDTSIGLRYGTRFAEPAISDPIAKKIVNFTHISGDKLGTNLVIGDVLASNEKDPAAGGGGGAQEFYGFFQRTFSGNALSGSKGFGPLKDISLVARFDLSAKDTKFAPRVRKQRYGVSFAMPVPAGFWDVGVQSYKESNHNGIVGRDVDFKLTSALASAWAIPLGAGVSFEGFLDVIGAKGKDGFGNETKSELLTRWTLMYKVGTSGVKAGVGIEYWKNKFGNDSATTAGAKQTTPMLLAQYSF
ncbi:MAG: outer envelope protein [Leptothrix sp. (in: b-proteobacteria)]